MQQHAAILAATAAPIPACRDPEAYILVLETEARYGYGVVPTRGDRALGGYHQFYSGPRASGEEATSDTDAN